MSWLPQRWRTQRNAIRHANRQIQWVIKTLNASCTSLGKYVCWSVCSSPSRLISRRQPLQLSLIGKASSDVNPIRTGTRSEIQLFLAKGVL